jgi:hypothetical protein
MRHTDPGFASTQFGAHDYRTREAERFQARQAEREQQQTFDRLRSSWATGTGPGSGGGTRGAGRGESALVGGLLGLGIFSFAFRLWLVGSAPSPWFASLLVEGVTGFRVWLAAVFLLTQLLMVTALLRWLRWWALPVAVVALPLMNPACLHVGRLVPTGEAHDWLWALHGLVYWGETGPVPAFSGAMWVRYGDIDGAAIWYGLQDGLNGFQLLAAATLLLVALRHGLARARRALRGPRAG